MLTLHELGKRYGPVDVVSGVDARIEPGEVVALLGENGAGKSTLSAMIAGVTLPTHGAMTWDDAPYAPASPADALAAGISLIHQEMRLLPDLSIAENVFVGRVPMKNGFVDRAAMNRHAGELVKRLGLDVSPETPVRRLRVAAQQQVEIAKALSQNARLLILDEPTSALGVKQSGIVLKYVIQARSEGKGVIFITHNPHHAFPVGDRFVLLKRGRMMGSYLKADTTLEQLTSMMAGGEELEQLSHELQGLSASDPEMAKIAQTLAADAQHTAA